MQEDSCHSVLVSTHFIKGYESTVYDITRHGPGFSCCQPNLELQSKEQHRFQDALGTSRDRRRCQDRIARLVLQVSYS